MPAATQATRIEKDLREYRKKYLTKKHIVIEVKSIQIDLNDRHLRQSLSYAANEGVDWILLFNGKQIKLFRVLFGKPISYHAVFDYDLADLSSIKKAAEDITVLSKKCVQKGELDEYWKRFNALTPISLVKAIYTEDVIRAIRLRLKKNTNIAFAQEDVAEAVQGLLIGGHAGATRPKVLKK